MNLINELSKQNIELAYYSSAFPLDQSLLETAKCAIILVDKKTTFKKFIDQNTPFCDSVSKYQDVYPEQKLLDLSIESGVFSRFKVDGKIGMIKFKELYKTWMINSVNKKIAKEVLVYKTKGIIRGFVTLGEKNLRADIGTIAVEGNSRGKGIGKSLMLSAENWFLNNTAYKEIQVVTQGDNTPACMLYEKCGYTIDNVEYFYHVWNKDNA